MTPAQPRKNARKTSTLAPRLKEKSRDIPRLVQNLQELHRWQGVLLGELASHVTPAKTARPSRRTK